MKTVRFSAPVHCRATTDGRPRSIGWFVEVELRVVDRTEMPIVATWNNNRYYALDGRLFTECNPYDGSWLLLDRLRVLEPDEDGEQREVDVAMFQDYPIQPPFETTDYSLDPELEPDAWLHPEFRIAAESVKNQLERLVVHDHTAMHPSMGPRIMVHRTRNNRDREVEVGAAVEFSQYAGPLSAFDMAAVVEAHREFFPSVVVGDEDPYPTILSEEGWSRQELSRIGVHEELQRLVVDMDDYGDWSPLTELDREAVLAHHRLRRVVTGGHAIELLEAVQGVVGAIDRGCCETSLERVRRWSAALKAIETIGVAPTEEAEHLAGLTI